MNVHFVPPTFTRLRENDDGRRREKNDGSHRRRRHRRWRRRRHLHRPHATEKSSVAYLTHSNSSLPRIFTPIHCTALHCAHYRIIPLANWQRYNSVLALSHDTSSRAHDSPSERPTEPRWGSMEVNKKRRVPLPLVSLPLESLPASLPPFTLCFLLFYA